MPFQPSSKISHRSGQGAEKLLGELEREIMRVAWNREPVTVRDVLDMLSKKRTLAYTTVMTVMSRLAAKGLLVAEKRGKAHQYRPAFSREEFEAQRAGQVVQSLIADFGGEVAVSQFVKQLSEVDPDQLARLAAMARRAKGEN